MIQWIQRKRNKKGFTLIELVVVIAILGLLAALAIPRLLGSRDKAKEGTYVASARTIASAVAVYQADGKGNEPKVSDLDEYLNDADGLHDDGFVINYKTGSTGEIESITTPDVNGKFTWKPGATELE